MAKEEEKEDRCPPVTEFTRIPSQENARIGTGWLLAETLERVNPDFFKEFFLGMMHAVFQRKPGEESPGAQPPAPPPAPPPALAQLPMGAPRPPMGPRPMPGPMGPPPMGGGPGPMPAGGPAGGRMMGGPMASPPGPPRMPMGPVG